MTALTAPNAIVEITPSAAVHTALHGWRAKCLQRLIRMDLPVPASFAISADAVRAIAAGQTPDRARLAAIIERADGLVSVRPSAQNPAWGGPGTVLNVGINSACHARLSQTRGKQAADALYLGFVQSYAIHVARLDPDMFSDSDAGLDAALRAYEDETDEEFPQDPTRQLAEVLRSMARAWDGPTARLLRQAKGAPASAPLGLVVQDMALAIGPGVTGSGTIQFVDNVTGTPRITGRFRGQTQGTAKGEGAETLYLTCDPRGPSLEEAAPQVFADLVRFGIAARERLREEMQIEFVVSDSRVSIIDAVRVQRSSRASVRIAVALARDGIIAPQDAVMRVEPRALSDLLHHQVDPRAPRDVIARGINASPGAATGRIVFNAAAAQDAEARGERCVLVRRETVPEDIRGMHASAAVLTERGGMTSHAAVIARGMGLPCIVGASGIVIDPRARTLQAGGRSFHEGEEITIDGTSGEVLAGAAEMLEPALDDSFAQLLEWADQECRISVRANADTPEDARTARMFNAQGIGLCRTEHMFFDEERLPAMREMIFATTPEDRSLSLERLLPMQRSDFTKFFEIMAGLPVTVRLLDPPLHEFLPNIVDQSVLVKELELTGASEDVLAKERETLAQVKRLHEQNPMLGTRGCRLAMLYPSIPDMQARAIVKAALAVQEREGETVGVEIMIPLVAIAKELEVQRDIVVKAVEEELAAAGKSLDYTVGTMIEIPRAALTANEIAEHADFFSFGTNDLTQTGIGISRDDAEAGFLGHYVEDEVIAKNPFESLDQEGVGQLVQIGVEKGRSTKAELKTGVCGEHGGDPDSIEFFHKVGLNYVSCSPFRVPIARLAAARATLQHG